MLLPKAPKVRKKLGLLSSTKLEDMKRNLVMEDDEYDMH